MRTCQVCDAKAENDEVFCTNCGAKIVEKLQDEIVEVENPINELENASVSVSGESPEEIALDKTFENAFENITSANAKESAQNTNADDIYAGFQLDNAQELGAKGQNVNEPAHNMYQGAQSEYAQAQMYTPAQSLYAPSQNNMYRKQAENVQAQNNGAQEISFGNWVGSVLLSMMPIAGIIALLVWAFSGETNTGKKNWARATLLVYAIFAVLTILLYVVLVVLMINAIM